MLQKGDGIWNSTAEEGNEAIEIYWETNLIDSFALVLLHQADDDDDVGFGNDGGSNRDVGVGLKL